MKRAYKTGAIFVMSILSAAILAQSTDDSKTLEKTNSATTTVCKRWTWIGDVYNRKVICLEWKEEKLNKESKNK